MQAPEGWRLWTSAVAVVLLAALHIRQAATLARSTRARAHVRERLAKTNLAEILPHTTEEFGWLIIVSLTAGVCEEFLFRGYFIWALAPWLGWWGAAALGMPIFGLLHAYQGRSGVVRTAIVGAVMTIVVAITRSLYPAMALHALVDMGSGLVVWIAQREVPPQGDAFETQASA
jgi:membrane protease YdiL (CAAX protease family)